MDLALSTRSHDGKAVVTVAGEVDLSNAEQLRTQLAEALDTQPSDIVLDLSQVTFMDSTGLQVLIATRRQLEARAGRLLLVGLSSAVAKVLQVTGLESSFPVFDSVEAALGSPLSDPA